MAWFGGFSGLEHSPRFPHQARLIFPDTPGLWISTDWPRSHLKAARHGERRVAVLGVCSVKQHQIDRLAVSGVPDDTAWAWPGSYVVVEAVRGKTTIWTDLCSARPIYTLTSLGGVFWGSSSLLLSPLNNQRLNLDHLARRLVLSGNDRPEDVSSCFADVELVRGGHRLVLTDTGHRISQQVWQPIHRSENHPRLLRRTLADAVALRVSDAQSPSVDFSGGFDSTALGLLAADRLGPSLSIPAVTTHPQGRTAGGDLDYAHEAARHPGIRHMLMAYSPEHSPFRCMTELSPSDEPAPSSITHRAFTAQLRWMIDKFGCDNHMTGDGGDALLSTPITLIRDLVRTDPVRALRETSRWARLRHISPAQVWRSVRRPFPPPRIPAWLTEGALGRVLCADTSAPTRFGSRAFTDIVNGIREVGRTAHSDAQIAAVFGIALHTPYTDSQVLDAYLSVRPSSLPSPSSYKPVMGSAMHDLFPTALNCRFTKGDSSGDHYQGLRRALPHLRELLHGHVAALGLIDPRRLCASLPRVASGVSDEMFPIANTIATEAWLRAVHESSQVIWTSRVPEAVR